MASSEDRSPRISFDEDDKRAYIVAYEQNPKFNVGDCVYLLDNGSRQGPYKIASVITPEKYTLSLKNGEAVRNGEEVDVDYLEAA